MQISVRGKQIDVNDRLRAYVEDELGHAVAKYFDRAIEGHVQFSREGGDVRTDISVHAISGTQFQSHAVVDDMHASFDLAVERVAKQLRRFKRRLVDHHQGARPGPEAEETMARQVVLSSEPSGADGDQAEAGPLTIAETELAVPLLTVREAVGRLEAESLEVLLFRNKGHDGINVVYKRRDGNIGWIDPHDENQDH